MNYVNKREKRSEGVSAGIIDHIPIEFISEKNFQWEFATLC